jgi:molecular chaperone HscB
MSATKPQPENASAASAVCWSCNSPSGGAHFCAACGKIQPLSREADYFAFFSLPQSLQVDSAALEQLFHQLSWKLHPDNFVKASEFERNLALERSSELNDAYRTLRDPISRVEYLLLRAGVRKEGTTKQQAPPELLEEVFELNEALDELREARAEGLSAGAASAELAELREKLAAAQHNFEEKLEEVDADLNVVFTEWDAALVNAGNEPARQALMAKLNELLNRRSYIRNLVRNVGEELAQS